MTMNRIKKIVSTMACLLIATGVWAGDYQIRINVPSNGTMTSNVTTANYGESVTLTINPTGDYYLSELYYEEVVTNIGVAESPRHRSPGFSEKINIPIKTTTQSNINNHYGGTYTISMPPYDIEVTAIFSPCTSITGATLHWDSSSSSTSITYDGYEHTANVYLGSSDLVLNTNYTITTNKQTNVCSITPTITGVGTYCGTINIQTLTIGQKNLNIEANAGQSKVFGDSDPTFTYTQTGLCSGDQITGALSRAAGEDVGTYAINQGTLTAGGNYDIVFTSQNFAITAKDLSTVALSDDVLKVTLDHEYFNYIENTKQKAQVTQIKYNGTELSSGTSYTYAYKKIGVYTGSVGSSGTIDNPQTSVDYITPDIYSIIITFTGNYQGTKEVKYQIRKPVTLNNSSYRWRTFYDPIYNMKVPEGFSAYTVRDVNTNAVEVDPRPYIKAGVPMLLHKPGDTYEFSLELVEPTNVGLNGWTASGYFKRNSSDMNLDEISKIQDDTRKIWILVNDKFVRSKSGTLAADKCYLELTGSNTVSFSRQLSLEPNATEIEQPVSDFKEYEDAIWYSLDGRRLQGKPTKTGIYITNGKKLIIK